MRRTGNNPEENQSEEKSEKVCRNDSFQRPGANGVMQKMENKPIKTHKNRIISNKNVH